MDRNLKNRENHTTLFYVHDPMCSWCWAFRRVWAEIQNTLPQSLTINYLVGGLAPDSEMPMPQDMQEQISSYWKVIQQRVPGTEFNFDFWTKNQARRSTYPSCRAVIAAKKQNAEQQMIEAIQKAYYLRAMNPSDTSILIQLAEELSLDVTLFSHDLHSDETQQKLVADLQLGRQIGIQGFPSLVLQHNGINHYIPTDYNNAETTLNTVSEIVS